MKILGSLLICSVIALQTQYTIAAPFESELNSDQILAIFAENEIAISQLMMELAKTNPEITIGSTVKEWVKRGKPSVNYSCSFHDSSIHSEARSEILTDAEMTILGQSISLKVNRKANSSSDAQVLPALLLNGKDASVQSLNTESISASWEDGETSIELKGQLNQNDETIFTADFKSDSNGPSGLTLEQDFAYGLTCTPRSMLLN
ncbi:MAG: hypothetical protein NT027_08100 [Proteobacteria bacterium]|nr:hypothetical protein [Pseudomonadota bacterium]